MIDNVDKIAYAYTLRHLKVAINHRVMYAYKFVDVYVLLIITRSWVPLVPGASKSI